MSSVFSGSLVIASTSVVGSTHIATISTTLAHGLIVGDVVHVENSADSQLNGVQTVTAVPTGTSFTCHDTAFTTSSGGAAGTVTVDRNLSVTIPSDGDGPGIKAADVNVSIEGIVQAVADIRQQLVGSLILRELLTTAKADSYSSTDSWAGATLTANTWAPLTQTLTTADGNPSDLLSSGNIAPGPCVCQSGDIVEATFTCAVNLSGESAAMGLAVVLNGALGSVPLAQVRIIPVVELTVGGPTPFVCTAAYKASSTCTVSFGLLANGIFTTTPAIICPNSWTIVAKHYRPIG